MNESVITNNALETLRTTDNISKPRKVKVMGFNKQENSLIPATRPVWDPPSAFLSLLKLFSRMGGVLGRAKLLQVALCETELIIRETNLLPCDLSASVE